MAYLKRITRDGITTMAEVSGDKPVRKKRTFTDRLRPFTDWESDVCWEDHGGCWIRQFGPFCYHFIEFFNWEEMVGKREAAEVGAKFNVSLVEVDLKIMPLDQVRNALRSSGWELGADGLFVPHSGDLVCGWDDENLHRCIAGALRQHGNKAPLDDFDTNAAKGGVMQARKFSMECSRDSDTHEDKLERPVNKIMTSARDYMTGDLSVLPPKPHIIPTQWEEKWLAMVHPDATPTLPRSS